MSLVDNPSTIAAVQDKPTSQTIEQFEYRFGPTDMKSMAEATARAGPKLIYPQTAGVYGALYHDALTNSWMDDNNRTVQSLTPSDIGLTDITPKEAQQAAATTSPALASLTAGLAQKAPAPSTYQAGAWRDYYGQDPELVVERAEKAGMGEGAPWYDVGSTHEYSLYQKASMAFDRKALGCVLGAAGTVGIIVALAWYLRSRKVKK